MKRKELEELKLKKVQDEITVEDDYLKQAEIELQGNNFEEAR